MSAMPVVMSHQLRSATKLHCWHRTTKSFQPIHIRYYLHVVAWAPLLALRVMPVPVSATFSTLPSGFKASALTGWQCQTGLFLPLLRMPHLHLHSPACSKSMVCVFDPHVTSVHTAVGTVGMRTALAVAVLAPFTSMLHEPGHGSLKIILPLAHCCCM